MKNLFTRMIALITAVVLIAVMCSCGKKKQDDKIHISVMIGIDPAEGALMQQWKDAFEAKHPEICVDIRNLPDSNYLQAMSTNVQSPDQMPDIMWTTGEQHAPWSAEGIFVDLSGRIKKDNSVDLGDFYEEVINITHKNSKDQGIYFMPRDYNKCVIFINKYMFRAAGFSEEEIASLKDGWNYDRFLQTCERLRKAMDADKAPDAGIRERSVPVDARMNFNASYMSFVKHYGGELIEDGKIRFDSQKNLDAFGRIFGLVNKGYIAELSKVSGCSFTNLGAAMKISVRPDLPAMPATEKYDIDFLPMPTDAVGIGCSGYAITYMAQQRVSDADGNKDKKTNEDYAYELLRFIVSEEGQKIGGQTGSIVPVLKSLANDPSWRSYISADLNHEAFIAAPEKDFNLAMFNDFSAEDSSVILNNTASVMDQVMISGNYADTPYYGGKDTAYTNLKKAITNFQNAVSSCKIK